VTTSRTFSRSIRVAAMFAAGTVLLVAVEGANAKGGGCGGCGGHSQSAHDGNFDNPFRNTIHPIIVSKPDRRSDRDKDYRDDKRHKGINSYPKPVVTNPPLPGTGGTNTIRPIINPNPVSVSSGPTSGYPGNVIVRDHRSGAPEGGVVVTYAPKPPVVRDHRRQ
jgi:hypothetical protein